MVEFLSMRNMDAKDRIYTKRTKELLVTVREIIKKKTGLISMRHCDLDMLVDYFAYA